jgi:anti-sigma B factor antagonist
MAGVQVSVSTCGRQVVIALHGDLDVVTAARVAAAVTAAGTHVIVDLADVEFIDCCALSALLGARELARLAGGDVLLAGPREPVLRVLDLTGRAGMSGIYASVTAAVASRDRYAAP